jgi:NADPH-dependent curcumin reductase CurA
VPLIGRQVEVRAYPRGRLTAEHFRVVDVAVPDPAPGEVLVRNTWTSVDPGMRLRLARSAPAGYFPAFPLHAPLDGVMTVGEVVQSRADGFRTGDTVWHAAGWREYSVVKAASPALGGLATLRRLDAGLAPARSYLGALGGMGLTAYAGLFEAGALRDGDVVWVSAAAGAVGSLAVQFAKLRGHRVIASAGSEAKVAYLRDELGADVAFNYKSAPLTDLLREAAPEGIDVYFDNVGGEHLEAALGALRRGGRVALCGAVSAYDRDGGAAPRNLFQATTKALTLRGFRGSSYVDLLGEMQRQVATWIADGRLRCRETIVDGLDRAPDALVGLLAGRTIGKTLVRIAP